MSLPMRRAAAGAVDRSRRLAATLRLTRPPYLRDVRARIRRSPMVVRPVSCVAVGAPPRARGARESPSGMLSAPRLTRSLSAATTIGAVAARFDRRGGARRRPRQLPRPAWSAMSGSPDSTEARGPLYRLPGISSMAVCSGVPGRRRVVCQGHPASGSASTTARARAAPAGKAGEVRPRPRERAPLL